MKFIKKIMMALLLMMTTCGVATAGVTTIVAKLDSTILLMGKTTKLHLEIVQDKDKLGFLPLDKQDTIISAIEIAERPVGDTIDLGHGRVQINRDFIIQSFDSGMYVIDSIPYIVGKDTSYTKHLTLKVVPVKVDSLQNIHDIKPVEGVPFHLFDWIPDFISDYWWVYLILLVLVAGGLYYYIFWYKKGRKITMPGRKRLSPYDEAMLNLTRLKSDNLWQNGQEKAYFTGLTDILRAYIDRRFEINAVEMTSSQIVETLKKNEETRAVNEQLSMILEIADIVKFANVRPLADDNELAFQRALNFVEATKPTDDTESDNEKKKEVTK